MTVLLTGVGAPGTKGSLFCLRNNPDGADVKVIGSDIKRDPVGKAWVSAFRRLPPPESDSYIDELNEACEAEAVDVVLPQTTRETIALSSTRNRVHSKVAVSGASAIRRANDKFALLKVFRSLGLPYPKFSLVKSAEELTRAAKEFGYPRVPVAIKPPVSYGSRGFRVLREGSEWTTRRFLLEKPSGADITVERLVGILERGKKPFPRLLLTEFLPGDEYSVDAFRGEKAAIAVPRLRSEVVNGISFQATIEPRKDLTEFTLKAASEIGLRYAFGFQYKLDPSGVPKVLECNPRVQGTMVASYFGGVNVIWMAVKEALGDFPEKVPRRIKRAVFRRYWGGLGFVDGKATGEI